MAIDAGGSDFQFYYSGVFTGDCGTDLDHRVTVVGYGTSDDGTKYWLIKNSWGIGWGKKRVYTDAEKYRCKGRTLWHCNAGFISYCLNLNTQ